MKAKVAIIGAGFAGSEAAWQLARRGIGVDLFEMRPHRQTEAHRTGYCAEPVCSNSFKSEKLENAHGLLKAELESQHSLIMTGARACRIPAGQALAVDREQFASWITDRLESTPAIRLCREEIYDPGAMLKDYAKVIVASGPLTSAALAENLKDITGAEYLYFYDASAPIVTTESIDMKVVYRASRYGKGDPDYLNCPLEKDQYFEFVKELRQAKKVPLHDFESTGIFEGCLPIEVLAERGEMTLAFGPMKPVGLPNPHTGKLPFGVVQLRQEDQSGSMYGLVGFQTKMTWPEQRRIFSSIPGLERAEFARLGSIHRNTFLDSPRLLNADLASQKEPGLHFAGQITGGEGYMESTATGLFVAKRVAFQLNGLEMPRPSPATMTGGLLRHINNSASANFQPMNANFGLLDLPPKSVKKKERKSFYAQRALKEISDLEKMEEASDNGSPGGRAEGPDSPEPII